MHKTARLITTYKCNKSCAGCCNREWKYSPAIPTAQPVVDLAGFDEIVITGGEPMLFADKLQQLLYSLQYSKKNPRIILYTAIPNYDDFMQLEEYLDGVTITLHDDSDVERFNRDYEYIGKNLLVRVNVFYKDIEVEVGFDPDFSYKYCEWIKDCPLPMNETLYFLDPIWDKP